MADQPLTPQHSLTPQQASQMMAHAWLEPAFKSQLEQDPTTAIKEFAAREFGIAIEVPFPVPPPPVDLSNEHLQAVAGGKKSFHTAPCAMKCARKARLSK